MRVQVASALFVLSVPVLAGCPASVSPPASQFPDADAAIGRMRATVDGCVALQASAKVDHRGKEGRVRGNVEMMVAVPQSIRMDVVSPFGVDLATLTSNADRFALADLRDKRFYVGRSSACNLARLTGVPVPPPVLVDLLRGQAPVLVHGGAPATRIAWSSHGWYEVTITGANDTVEEMHLAPPPEDFAKPWSQQRVRVLYVVVRQGKDAWYDAELADHAPPGDWLRMATPRVDPDGIDPPIPVSGPVCSAELPRRIRVEVPWLEEDILFRYDQATWNPPIPQGQFDQPPRPGLVTTPVSCD